MSPLLRRAARCQHHDLLKLFPFGTTQFGLGLVFLAVGGQMVSATENALINTLETPLAVALVSVCFAEVPIVANFAGGMILMAQSWGMSGTAIGRGSRSQP